MKTLFSKKVFNTILLFVLIIIYFFKFKVAYNEMDVLPYAKAVYDKNWIPNDWYLGLKIPYRYFFSYPIGFLISTIGWNATIIIGRLLSYLFIAFGINKIIQLYTKQKHYLYFIAVLLFFMFFPNGNGAGEWLVGGLDTKVFSYGFVLLSIYYTLQKKYSLALLLCGFSLSFHLLVGLYNILCITPLFIIAFKRKWVNVKNLLFGSILFCVGGSIGIYGIIHQFFLSEPMHDNIGWDIYVNIRVNHHVLPSYFPFEFWIKMLLFSILNIIILFGIKNENLRQIAIYSLTTVLISIIGLLIFFSGNTTLLRFYFFRTSDILLPFFSLLSMIYLLSTFLNKKNIYINFEKPKINLARVLSILLILSFTSYQSFVFINNANRVYSIFDLKANISADQKLHDWIKTNASNLDIIITNPNDWNFYINNEKAVFTTWKHLPQSNQKIIEWYKRVKLLNSGQEIINERQTAENYRALDTKSILRIKEEYPQVTYILFYNKLKESEIDLPIAIKTDYHTLYQLN